MTIPIAVLIVEDSSNDAQLIVRSLKKAEYEVTFQVVETAAQMSAALLQAKWDIVISDYSLPQFDGPAALMLLQKSGLDIPFIVVSGMIGEETAVAMLKAGAQDYLIKGNLARLAPVVERELLAADAQRKRNQTEAKLRKSEAQFRTIIQTAMDGFWLLDIEGRLLEVNETASLMSGYSISELLTMHVSDLEITGTNNAITAHRQKIRSAKEDRFESQHRRKDGTIIDVEVCVQLRTVEDEQMVVFFRDITERKQIEAYRELGIKALQILSQPGDLRDLLKLFIGELRAQTGFNAAGIRIQDKNDFPYLVQEGFSKDFLKTENTLVERASDGTLCRDSYGNICLECTCGLVISGKADPADPLFTKGGSFYTNDSSIYLDIPATEDPRLKPRNNCIHKGYASIALVPIRSNNGIIGLIQLNDHRKGRFSLTVVKILEEIATHIGGALMRRRAEDENIKLEDLFQQAQKMESVGRLAGGVAHDFNNMLSVIIGHTEIAQMLVDQNHPIFSNLEEIHKAAERSAKLTRQLLAFARKQTVVPKVLNLNETVASMLNMLKRLIGENIELSWRPGANPGLLKIDPSQIDQILANLCVNARDAISGVGKLTISTGKRTFDKTYCESHLDSLPGEYIQLIVTDNGSGMTNETLSHIFEPFFTTKELGKGTGLGLAMVYGAVKQNNGFIVIESEPGLGTVFTINLPLYAGNPEPASAEKVIRPVLHSHETILLVEDEPEVRKIASIMLKIAGHTVLEASSPDEAISLAKAHAGEIHLLITDVVMPEMNGRDLARNLQALNPNLKWLFISGYTPDVIADNGVFDEGTNFLQKPFSAAELSAKIRESLAAS